MPKYRVYVTASCNEEFEIEAEDAVFAMQNAEDLFKGEFSHVWAAVQAVSYEMVEDEDEDDGF